MTLVAQIIKDAFREGNLISIGETPSANEQEEALRILQRFVRSILGNSMGDPLTSYPIGRTNVITPSGYPIYSTPPGGDWFIPDNTRIVANLASAISVPLHPLPEDGARMAVIDAAANLDTYNLTLQGNGRMIEGATSLTLSTASLSAEWFYRADLGDWKRVSDLVLLDEMPFPEEFDDLFIIFLAMRINPRNTIPLDSQSGMAYAKALKEFKARYSQRKTVRSELGITRLSNYGPYINHYSDYWVDSTAEFNGGRVW